MLHNNIKKRYNKDMSNAMLEKEFQYYIDHQSELADKYDGKYAVIADGQVIGVYDDRNIAISETTKTRKLGTFLVHLVGRGEDNYTAYALNIGISC